MIRRIKERLKITDSERDLEIEALIEEIKLYVMSYCNLDLIPTSLNIFIENKVIAELDRESSNIKSITEGDTSITYKESRERISKEDKAILRRYRKLLW